MSRFMKDTMRVSRKSYGQGIGYNCGYLLKRRKVLVLPVPRPPDTNIVRCMWIFCHKYLDDGTLSRYKARLVANGSTQLEGVDMDETFSPVVKLGTIWTVLSLVASRHWPIHQLDVKNDFLHGDLSETVYMHQPSGFRDTTHPDYVCLLQRSLYGLKQEIHTTYLLLYVDDIVLTASSEGLLQRIIGSLHQEFAMIDFCHLNCFLGISVTRDSSVQQVCLHMHDPRDPHLSTLKRILWYVQGTLNYGLQLFSSSTRDLVAYFDADWAGCPTTRRSTSGYCIFLGNNLLSWFTKCQPTLSWSSAKVEYRSVTNAVAETCWLRNLLRELHTPLSAATLVYCDNVSAVYLSSNPVQHQRTKHIEIDIHFVHDLFAVGQVRVLHEYVVLMKQGYWILEGEGEGTKEVLRILLAIKGNDVEVKSNATSVESDSTIKPVDPKIVSKTGNNDGVAPGSVTFEQVMNLEATNNIKVGNSAIQVEAEQVGNGSQNQSPLSYL
ncbi:ribonuclease H-like domain-containing protein [Tanacetum coccineum]